MSDKKLQLQVSFSAIDKLTAPLKSLQKNTSLLSKSYKETQKQLKSLQQQASNVEKFKKLSSSINENSQALSQAQLKAQLLTKEMAAMTEPTKKQTKALTDQWSAVSKLEEQQKKEISQLNDLRAQLYKSGISAKDTASATQTISAKTASLNEQLAKENRLLKENGQQQAKVIALQKRYAKTKETAGKYAMRGVMMVGGGVAGLAALHPAIAASAVYQNQTTQFKAMGVDNATIAQSQQKAAQMNVDGSSMTENYKLIKEGYSVLRDKHEALMIAPGLAQLNVGLKELMTKGLIPHQDDEEMERMSQSIVKIAEQLPDGVKNQANFQKILNLAFKGTASGAGLINPNDYRDMVKRGGNAVTSLDLKELFFTMSHLIQEQGGDAVGNALASGYSNVVMGHMTQNAANQWQALGLLDQNHVHYSKTGRLKNVDPGAVLHQQDFIQRPYEYLMKYIVPAINKKTPGLNELGVQTEIAKLFSNRKAAQFYVALYSQRHNIDKQNKGGNAAQTISQVTSENKNTYAGAALALKAQKENLETLVGNALMPTYVKLLRQTGNALKYIGDLIKAHPTATKNFIIAFAGIAGVVALLGSLAIAVSAVLMPLAMLRYSLGALGIVMELNPVMLTITAIIAAIAALGAAAYEIHKHWDPIKKWFSDLWRDISHIITTAINFVKTEWNNLIAWIEKIPAKFKSILDDIKKMLPSWMTSGTVNTPPVSMSMSSFSPLVAGPMTGAAGASNANITINVHPSPGMNEKQLAQHAVNALQQQQRKQASKQRSRLGDID